MEPTSTDLLNAFLDKYIPQDRQIEAMRDIAAIAAAMANESIGRVFSQNQ